MTDLIINDQMAGNVQLLHEGIQQTKAGYHTAVSVQRPRDLRKIRTDLKIETEIAGEHFFYSWKVFNKRTNRYETVEGLSVGAEIAIARAFGNCVIEPSDFKETDNSFLFKYDFVDLEKGFTVSRVFKQSKSPAPGKYDVDRWNDMQLQIGQSKALRNVIKAGVPSWLQEEVLKIAKQAVLDQIQGDGIQKAIDKVIKFLAGHGVPLEKINEVMDKDSRDFTVEDVATLRGMCSQINEGTARAEELFQMVDRGVSSVTDRIKGSGEETARNAEPEKEKPGKVHKAEVKVEDDAPPRHPGVTENEPPEPSDDFELSEEGLKKLTVQQLKDCANNYQIQGYKSMTKPQLIEAILKEDELAREEVEADSAPDKDSKYFEWVNKFNKSETALDCSRFIVRNSDEMKKDLTPDEWNDFNRVADERIIELRKQSA
jgi:hypothetical protein